ncbi:hypothetical protein [Pseudoalteromonas sp. B62]|uniref:hypothetical protein n=1 Tax=Pseudoalteromonas sp. B62 TaxID=630483 RepID=UPI00301B9218
MIKEVTNSIKAALYQRISSPLYGTYIFSWIIYNWELVLQLLFGTKQFDERLATFKLGLTVDDGGFNYCTVIIPFIITVVILLIQPLAQRFIYIYTEWNNSEGLKKRDQYANETLLTLEQSNELRSSVQKVQQFHQEVLKNKDDEISEYKKQAEFKDTSLGKINEDNLRLQTNSSELESEKSKLSTEITSLNGEITKIKSNYDRLGKLFLKSRRAKQRLVEFTNHNKWLISEEACLDISKVIILDTEYNLSENVRIFSEMLSISDSERWKQSCHELMIAGFSKSWSYNMADHYFSEIIKPNLIDFNNDHIRLLIKVMDSNNQISERNKANSDMQLVQKYL